MVATVAGRELFIYWRTPGVSCTAAEDDVRHWQALLRSEYPGLITALYRRADEAGPSVTLMETYAGALIDEACERRIVSGGNERLARWFEGSRNVDVFVRLPAG